MKIGKMKIENLNKKKEYVSPELRCIKIDKEISLQMESDPPYPGDDEITYYNQANVNDPYKNRA